MMKKVLAIYGAGSHSKDIVNIVNSTKEYCSHISFYDDNIDKYLNIDFSSKKAFHAEEFYIIGANWPWDKKNISKKINTIRQIANPIIHNSVTGDKKNLSKGVVIGAQTDLGCETFIGMHTHVGAGVTITRAEIGDYCTIGPGANICGDVFIGNDVVIGAGSTIANLVSIGDGAIIGAGAVVIRDVFPGEKVVGVPARVL